MTLETFRSEFLLAVEKIAESIWLEFGDYSYADATQVSLVKEKIELYVKFCGWIVSDNYTKIHKKDGLPCKTRSEAIETMIEIVENETAKIIEKNKPFYWSVKFPEANRFLMVGEVENCFNYWQSETIQEQEFTTKLILPTEIEAEEAAECFCKGYFAAGMQHPQIRIVGFNLQDKENPHSKLFVSKNDHTN